jgi:2-polyprenyl-3-methyl-5-hydroxy-6-metoxy-1,4-benzoquinol methylase
MLLGESNGGRLLDVGCGDGEFLNRMRNEGWSVDGVDFDRQAIENANRKYGMKLQCGSITTPGFAEASFDAITLYHVIEHVPDPLEVFFECHRLLKPGGCLVMATPNAESLGHRTFGNCWRGLEPPRHLQLFSPRTLAECARRARLEVVRAYSTAANADVIAGASLSIQENPAHRSSLRPAPSLGRTLKAMVFQYREHLLLKRQPGAGEEAVLDCRKKDG